MQTSFYVSGFLYSLKTHQILLLHSRSKNDDSSIWSTLGGKNKEGEEARFAFQRIINKSLNINLKSKDIYPIYDYFHSIRNKFNYVFYAEVGNTKRFADLRKGNPSWLSFNEVAKLPFVSWTKQDIVVGERVINAKLRDDEAKKLQGQLA